MKDLAAPEFIRQFIRERALLTLVISPHAERPRPGQKSVSANQIQLTIQDGKLIPPDCQQFPERPYDKYAVTRYFAAENRTIKAILTVNWTTWLCYVETLWTYRGRKTGPITRSKRKSR